MSTNQLAVITSEIPSIASGYYQPVKVNVIESLLAKHEQTKSFIENLDQFMSDDSNKNALNYFMRGQKLAGRGYINLDTILNKENALKMLNSDSWSGAMKATDVMQHMPQKRKDEWSDMIDQCEAPEFEAQTVVATLKELILSRDQFLAEKVDGIFKRLSGTHVTNSPEGFNKKMIIDRIHDGWSNCWSSVGYINDLRGIIAKFMNRDTKDLVRTDDIITHCRSYRGEWQLIDGGSMRIKVYMVGTAHIEIHPDIAHKLNDILSFLHPLAIPSEFRKQPKKKFKKFTMIDNLIPNEVISLISGIDEAYDLVPNGRVNFRGNEGHDRVKRLGEVMFPIVPDADKHVIQKAKGILLSCGGVEVENNYFKFDYDFLAFKGELISYGAVPDQKTHQFYPTPSNIAERAVELCEIESHHVCLEPSAGQGNIAKFMPKNTACVEISKLHCEILTQSGFESVHHGDFVDWAKTSGEYDRIVMNPPFSQGRVEQHLTTAANLLKVGGILTIICPPSGENLKKIPGFEYEIFETFENEFKDASVDVIIMKLTRKEYK